MIIFNKQKLLIRFSMILALGIGYRASLSINQYLKKPSTQEIISKNPINTHFLSDRILGTSSIEFDSQKSDKDKDDDNDNKIIEFKQEETIKEPPSSELIIENEEIENDKEKNIILPKPTINSKESDEDNHIESNKDQLTEIITIIEDTNIASDSTILIATSSTELDSEKPSEEVEEKQPTPTITPTIIPINETQESTKPTDIEQIDDSNIEATPTPEPNKNDNKPDNSEKKSKSKKDKDKGKVLGVTTENSEKLSSLIVRWYVLLLVTNVLF